MIILYNRYSTKGVIKLLFHYKNIDNTLTELQSNMQSGLQTQECERRLEQYGSNKLSEQKKKSTLTKFFEQFKDTMIIILLLAALVSFSVKIIEGNTHELFEPLLILLIVIMNAVMGVMQENKAEQALEALKNMSALHCKVLRDSTESIIDASLLVPGDIIRLEAGDFVPADARILKSANLKSEESALTGESVASEKDALAEVGEFAPLGDRHTMLYSGCSITYGTALAVVTATGRDTEMGKIANLLENEQDTQTPLQQKLSKLGKYLGFAALLACGIIFAIGLIYQIPLLEIFTISVSLAVSAIPEGLPAIVTIVLAIGVQRLAKKNSIIRRLPAVETLGSASIICSDKTGTLTQNKMTLVRAYAAATKSLEEINSNNSWAVRKMLNFASLCSDGSVHFAEDGTVQHVGDPTETAILVAAHKNGTSKEQLLEAYPRIAELPFDSDRKRMCTIHNIDGIITVIVKGAFDSIAQICNSNQAEKLQQSKAQNDAMSTEALRVLAIATKELDSLPEEITIESIENDLVFLGLVGMIDPPREEAKEAVSLCRKAGIKPIMITGDHVVTASAIAKQLGILEEGDLAITGAELDNLNDTELDAKLAHISVYARVSPENKIRIVKAWQRKGKIVSMTGDGVNDAPALKAADIGCAMGITGTDVAKGAADMVLTDDNFATIVSAVREGRGIYDNIKKVVGFLLGTNIGEITTVFLAMLLWHASPLLSMQLLWINLVTDSLPAIALGMEPIEKDIMDRKPIAKDETIFSHGYGLQILLQGFMFGILSLAAYWLGVKYGQSVAAGRTMSFLVLSLSQIVQAFNMRSHHSLFKIGFWGNSMLNKAALISIALILLVVITPLSIPFGIVALNTKLYSFALALAITPLLVMEIGKLILNKNK